MTMPVVPDDESFGDRVYRYRLDQAASARATAKHFGITTKEVHQYVMERAPQIDHEGRANEVALDFARIESMSTRFYDWTMNAEQPQEAAIAASIWIRLNERKSAILGLDIAPRRSDTLTLIDQTPRTETSTQRIRAIIEGVVRDRSAPTITNGKPSAAISDPDVLPFPPSPANRNGDDPDDDRLPL